MVLASLLLSVPSSELDSGMLFDGSLVVATPTVVI